ncbi:exopolyphosphatase [Egibacter rhizosphaerae]|uniref:Exopolyphosphatase n=2 Tax=Egibacter rhizosphaerae TaxID=1670831 RepID=A0A411YLN5_9ACTN|nr:exopolyphosphatase [Egibacter rhizosphaerae]
MIVTRLGEGVDASGHLADGALERTVEAVAGYVATARAHGADPVRVVATSAVRDAADRDRFVAAVHDATGVHPDVLAGEEEASIAFAGAVQGAQAARPALVLDIGGGSTELIAGHDVPEALVSENLGCVRLTELALPGDPPTAEAVERARGIADEALARALHRLDAAAPGVREHARSIVAVAGTATTLAALHLGLDRYDAHAIHGTTLPAEAVTELAETLAVTPTARIAAWGAAPGAERGPVAAGREDVLLAGAVILERALERLGFAAALVSEADLLDGGCAQLLGFGPPGRGDVRT